MTTTLNHSINETLKEFQSIQIKTVEKMITKQMSVINIDMIQTTKSILTGQKFQQELTQEMYQQTIKTIDSSPLT